MPTTKLMRKKSQNLYLISAVFGGQHIVELTTSTSAPQILFQIYFACWLYFIPVSNPILSSEIALAIHYSGNKLRKFVATNLEVKQEGRFIF